MNQGRKCHCSFESSTLLLKCYVNIISQGSVVNPMEETLLENPFREIYCALSFSPLSSSLCPALCPAVSLLNSN